jgi:hypothetical protein
VHHLERDDRQRLVGSEERVGGEQQQPDRHEDQHQPLRASAAAGDHRGQHRADRPR